MMRSSTKVFVVDLKTLVHLAQRAVGISDSLLFIALNTSNVYNTFVIDSIVKKDLDETIINYVDNDRCSLLTDNTLDDLTVALEELAILVFSSLSQLTDYSFDPMLIVGHKRINNALVLEVSE